MLSLGERIEKSILEGDVKMKKKDVANALQVHPNTITGWIKNEIIPSVNKVKELSFLTGMDLYWIITGMTAEESAARKFNNNVSLAVHQGGPQWRTDAAVELVGKLVKLNEHHRAVIEELISLYSEKENAEK